MLKSSKKPFLIGICGRKRSGKDSISDMFIDKFGFVKRSFAGPLKEACCIIFGFNDEQINGNLKETIDETWGMTPRYILQAVGTDLLRNQIDKNIWIKSMERFLLNNPNKNVIIPDIRFSNEADFVRTCPGRQGILIKVERPSLGVNKDMHPSETEMENYNKCDFLIVNNQSLAYLQETLFNKLVLDITKRSIL
jgi:hypothetical protein